MSTNENVTVSDGIHIWERSLLPFRADPSNADTQVDNLQGFIDIPEKSTGNAPINKGTLGVYTVGTEITLELDSSTTGAGTSKFGGNDAQLVVARLDENQSAIADLNDEYNTTTAKKEAEDANRSDSIQRALNLLTLENANENASFEVLDDEEGVKSIDEDGDLTVNYTPSESGTYVVFLATVNDGTGFDADADGNLSVDGDVTVVGLDQFAVQQTPAVVNFKNKDIVDLNNPNDFELGDQVYFEADSQLDGENNVSHVMVLYHEETFTESMAKMVVEGDIDRNMTADQVTFEHDIEHVHGKLRARDEDYTNEGNLGIDVLGTTIGDGTVEREFSVGGLVDLIAERTNETLPGTTATDSDTLPASATVVKTASPKQFTGLRVETLDSWDKGWYRFVYVAVGEDESQMSTDTGRFWLAPAESKSSPDISVTSAALSKSTIDEGETATVTSTVKNTGDAQGKFTAELTVDGTIVAQKTVTLDAGASTDVTFNRKFNDAGSYEIGVSGVSAGTLTVKEVGGGGGGGGGSIAPPSTIVDPVTDDDGTTSFEISNPRPGQTISLGFRTVDTSANGAAFELMRLTHGANGNFDVSVTPLESAPSSVDDLDGSLGVSSLSFFQIDHSIGDEDIDGVEFTFRVEKDTLGDEDPENVALYRYHDGQWNELDTEYDGERGSTYRFKAQSPGMSVFAVGTKHADISVTDAALDSDEITVGDAATVTATVENDGDGKGTFTAELTVDGSAVAEQEVTLEGGETREVEFTHTFDAAGTYDVAVGGASAGTLTVTDGSDTGTTGPDGTPDPEEEEDDEGMSAALIALLVIILVAAVAGVGYFIRQQQ